MRYTGSDATRNEDMAFRKSIETRFNMASRTTKSSQQWLRDRRKALGYRDEDVCLGVTQMIIRAAAARKLNDFDQRIGWLSNISPDELKKLSEENPGHPYVVEARAFFDSIELYQQGYYYERLFNAQNQPGHYLQNQSIFSDWLKPVEGPKAIKVAGFSTVYTRESFSSMLDSFRKFIKKAHPPITQPISFAIDIIEHSNPLIYDPVSDAFTYISTNHVLEDVLTPKYKEIKNTKDIAKQCFSDFSLGADKEEDWNILIPNLSVYIPEGKDIEETLRMERVVQDWQKSPEFKDVHQITTIKATEAWDYAGNTWMSIAVREGQLSTVNQLLEKKADPNRVNRRGTSPLILAAEFGHYEIVDSLLKHHADTHLQAYQKLTALHSATAFGSFDIIKALMDNKADPYVISSNHKSVLGIARVNRYKPGNKDKYQPIVELLEKRFIADKQKLYDDILAIPDNKISDKRSVILDRFKGIISDDKNKIDEQITQYFPFLKFKTDEDSKKIICYSTLNNEYLAFKDLDNFIHKIAGLKSKNRSDKATLEIDELIQKSYETLYNEIRKGGNYKKAYSNLRENIISLYEKNSQSKLLRSLHEFIIQDNSAEMKLMRENKQMIPMAAQKDWGCDLYSVAAVMQKLYDDKLITEKPLPARKRDKADAKSSLREHAKKISKEHHSENIRNPDVLLQLAHLNRDVTAIISKSKSMDDYCKQLTDAVDYTLFPVVFFDIDSKSGQPVFKNGENEHVAVIVNYAYTNDKLIFKVVHWQREYEIDADKLYASTNQLNDDKDRKSEDKRTFQKIRTKEGEGAWFPKDKIKQFVQDPNIIDEYDGPARASGLYAANILIIDSIHRRQWVVSELEKYVKKLAKKSNGLLEKARAESLNHLIEILSDSKGQSSPLLHMQIEEWKKQPSNYKAGDQVLSHQQIIDGLHPSPFVNIYKAKTPKMNSKVNLIDIKPVVLDEKHEQILFVQDERKKPPQPSRPRGDVKSLFNKWKSDSNAGIFARRYSTLKQIDALYYQYLSTRHNNTAEQNIQIIDAINDKIKIQRASHPNSKRALAINSLEEKLNEDKNRVIKNINNRAKKSI